MVLMTAKNPLAKKIADAYELFGERAEGVEGRNQTLEVQNRER